MLWSLRDSMVVDLPFSFTLLLLHFLNPICYFLCLVFPNTFNPLTPNDPYSGRTAPLTSKRCILYIYSTNTGTEYFNHVFFSWKCSLFRNSNIFGSCIIHILYTGCAKIKKNNSSAKRLILCNNFPRFLIGVSKINHFLEESDFLCC